MPWLPWIAFIWFENFKDSLGITFGRNVCSLGEFLPSGELVFENANN
jgi:hypothetical protein